VLVAGIPYRGRVGPGTGFADGVEAGRPLVDAGRDEAIATDPDACFFSQGTVLLARWDGHSRHAATGERVLRLVAPPPVQGPRPTVDGGTSMVKYRVVKDCDDQVASDGPLVPLLRLLQARGIEPCAWCPEYRPGTACIEFAATADVEEFLDLAQRRYPVLVEAVDEGQDGRLVMHVRLLVLFPTRHIPRLARVLARATKGLTD
jgi:hypothetical protein